jgi:hypothetical protein
MDSATLFDAIVDAGCPAVRAKVGKSNDRSTWSFTPESTNTQQQNDIGANVIATMPIDALGKLSVGDFISRWTNAEYLALQKRRTTDNGKMAKDWDQVVSESYIDMNKKKTQTLKSNLVADGILTQARADVIFI